jgi:hypothetical protein
MRGWFKAEKLILQPKSKQVVYGKIIGEKPQISPTIVCVEPAQIHIEGVCAAHVLSHVYVDNHNKQRTDLHVSASRTQTATHELQQTPHCDEDNENQGCSSTPNHCLGTVLLVLANFSDEELSLTATILGLAHEVSENLLVSINAGKNDGVCSEQLFASNETKANTNSKFQSYLDER